VGAFPARIKIRILHQSRAESSARLFSCTLVGSWRTPGAARATSGCPQEP
jgi:hypothetical protein